MVSIWRDYIIEISQIHRSKLAHLYSGHYGEDIDIAKLKDFHRRRLQVLAGAGPDLLAFETIPNRLETQVCCFSSIISLMHF